MSQLSNKQFYEKLCKQELSNEEVFEAKSNFVGFFNLLYQIDKRLSEKNNEQDNGNSNNPY
jgi:hypothetical protein